MSVHYESLQAAALYEDVFKVAAPAQPLERGIWPRKPGAFIRLQAVPGLDAGPVAGAGAQTGAGDAGGLVGASMRQAAPAQPVDGVLPATQGAPLSEPAPEPATEPAPDRVRELVLGQCGLVPAWVKSASDAKLRSTKLVNARSEAVTTSNNFRGAWLKGQRCIVPMMAFIEDDWRSGKAVPTRVTRVDGKPMGVAGLWELWVGPNGEEISSYTLLTVNANSHALIRRYQHAGVEKRMLAVLNEGSYGAWLTAHPEKARGFLRAYPANWLTANPVQG